jgi:putative addiction module component (TIGR02574 family)
MSSKANDLFTIIENMPIDVKTALIERILDSIHPLQKDVDQEWIEVAEKRTSEIQTGNVQVIPGDEVFKEIEERYKR